MKKALIVIAIAAIVAIVGSLIYYYVFFRTGIEKAEIKLQEQKLEQEKEKQKTEEQKDLNKKVALFKALADLEKRHNDGLDQAYKDYRAQWDKECERLGLKPESPLPIVTADTFNEYYDKAIKRIDESYQSQKDDIYKLYE